MAAWACVRYSMMYTCHCGNVNSRVKKKRHSNAQVQKTWIKQKQASLPFAANWIWLNLPIHRRMYSKPIFQLFDLYEALTFAQRAKFCWIIVILASFLATQWLNMFGVARLAKWVLPCSFKLLPLCTRKLNTHGRTNTRWQRIVWF